MFRERWPVRSPALAWGLLLCFLLLPAALPKSLASLLPPGIFDDDGNIIVDLASPELKLLAPLPSSPSGVRLLMRGPALESLCQVASTLSLLSTSSRSPPLG